MNCELRFHAHKVSYEFCRRMELLPTDVHRIVALAEIPLTSASLNFLSTLATCRAQMTPFAIPIFFARFKKSNSKSSRVT